MKPFRNSGCLAQVLADDATLDDATVAGIGDGIKASKMAAKHGDDVLGAAAKKLNDIPASKVGLPQTPTPKKRKSGLSRKEAATDIPSWAGGGVPNVGESGKQFARRLLDAKYGTGKYPTGPGSEFSKLKKYADRAFE